MVLKQDKYFWNLLAKLIKNAIRVQQIDWFMKKNHFFIRKAERF